MEDFLKRLMVEREELKEKIDKLEPFIETEDSKFKFLNQVQRSTLILQLSCMRMYLSCLDVRINNLIE